MKTYTQSSSSGDNTYFPYYGELGTTNLNSLKSAQFGLYIQSKSGNLYSGLNYPEGSPGSLMVLPTHENGCCQEYRPCNNNILYRRRYFENTILWAWSDWCQEYSTENLPVAASTNASASLPGVGAIILWASASAPAGWLTCDGSSFSPEVYPALADLFRDGRLPLLNVSESSTLRYIVKAV